MKCRECGHKLNGDERFCSYCGANVTSVPEYDEIEDEIREESEDFELDLDYTDSSVDESEEDFGNKTPRRSWARNRQSLGETIKEKLLAFWNGIDLFCKVITVASAIAVLLLLVAICTHTGLAVFFSIAQVIGLVVALLMHKGIMKQEKGWVKYLILVIAILFTAINIMSYSLVNNIPSSDATQIVQNQPETTISAKPLLAPFGAADCVGADYLNLSNELSAAGFVNISTNRIEDLKASEADRVNTVDAVLIDGSADFVQGQEFDRNANIVINYHAYAKCKVSIHVDFVENLIFSKYDVKFSIGDSTEQLSHGQNADFEYSVEPGEYTITFANKDSSSVRGETTLNVNGDVNASYKIFCHSDDINIETQYVEKIGSVGENEIMLPASASEYEHINFEETERALRELGFTNISSSAVYDIVYGVTAEGSVESVSIDGNTSFVRGDIFASDAEVVITYHMRQKVDTISLPQDLSDYIGKDQLDVESELQKLGFTNIVKKEVITRDISHADGEVCRITIEGNPACRRGEKFKSSQTVYFDYFSIGEPQVITMTADSKSFVGQKPNEVEDQLANLGFLNIVRKEMISTETDNENGMVATVLIEQNEFESGEQFLDTVEVVISVWKSPSSTTKAPTNPNAVSYSTNDQETAKKGNCGVFAYKRHHQDYDNYYIIDFDEGYVYFFSNGNGDATCDRLKIESGDLNNVLIITYHDGDSVWSEGLHFKWKKQPDHLVVEDNDHFEYDFYTTNLNSALSIKNSRRIIDY